MVTISERKNKLPTLFGSIRFRIFVTYLVIVAAVLTVLNIYPVRVTKDFIFESKYNTLKRQCRLITSSMNEIETLTEENVAHIIDVLEMGEVDSIIVVDSEGNELMHRRDSNIGIDERYLWSLNQSLMRNDAFYSKYDGGTFLSVFSMPIVYAGRINGAVTVLDRDADQGGVLSALKTNILRITAIISAFTVVLSLIITKRLTSGIRNVVKGISNVREGEYNYRINVPGKDEMALLADEFNSLTDRLQKTEEIRRQFVADASHELKTPLASIQLLSDSIVQNGVTDSETVTEFVADIGNEARRLARTTDKLLRLTNLDNRIVSEIRIEDLSIVAEREIKMLRPIADERKIKVKTHFESGSTVFASRDDLAQIVINLVENAIKYNVDGGLVTVCVWNSGKRVYMSVTDTGVGIPESEIPMVFDRFYRVDKARSRAAGGSGLGLSIVRSTVDKYGGSIEAAGKCDGGMVFLVTLQDAAETASQPDDTATFPLN